MAYCRQIAWWSTSCSAGMVCNLNWIEVPWCLLHSFFFIGFEPISTCRFGVAHAHFLIELLFLGLSFCSVDGTLMEIGYWLLFFGAT